MNFLKKKFFSASAFYYYYYKRTVLSISDPKFYDSIDLSWVDNH